MAVRGQIIILSTFNTFSRNWHYSTTITRELLNIPDELESFNNTMEFSPEDEETAGSAISPDVMNRAQRSSEVWRCSESKCFSGL